LVFYNNIMPSALKTLKFGNTKVKNLKWAVIQHPPFQF